MVAHHCQGCFVWQVPTWACWFIHVEVSVCLLWLGLSVSFLHFGLVFFPLDCLSITPVQVRDFWDSSAPSQLLRFKTVGFVICVMLGCLLMMPPLAPVSCLCHLLMLPTLSPCPVCEVMLLIGGFRKIVCMCLWNSQHSFSSPIASKIWTVAVDLGYVTNGIECPLLS